MRNCVLYVFTFLFIITTPKSYGVDNSVLLNHYLNEFGEINNQKNVAAECGVGFHQYLQKSYCPGYLNERIKTYNKSSWFKLDYPWIPKSLRGIQSPVKACIHPLVSEESIEDSLEAVRSSEDFAFKEYPKDMQLQAYKNSILYSARELENYFRQSTEFDFFNPKLQSVNIVANCIDDSMDPSIKKGLVADYYYQMKRIQDGNLQTSKILASINNLLGLHPSDQNILCDSESTYKINKYCNSIANCTVDNKIVDIVEKTKLALSTPDKLSKQEKESLFPWIMESSLTKSSSDNSIKDAITDHLTSNKEKLIERLKENQKGVNCLTQNDADCDDIDRIVNLNPEVKRIDSAPNTPYVFANAAMGTAQCLNKIEQTKSEYNKLTRDGTLDISLTLLTGGAGSGAKMLIGKLAGKAVTHLNTARKVASISNQISRGPRKLRLAIRKKVKQNMVTKLDQIRKFKAGTVATALVDAYYFHESIEDALLKCSSKLQGLDKININQLSCPESPFSDATALSEISALESNFEECAWSIATAAGGLLPYAIPVNKVLRKNKQVKQTIKEKFDTLDRPIASSSFPNITNKNDLIDNFNEYEAASENMNRMWIDIAKKGKADNKLFFEVENAAIKRLNDELGDKDLVTSLTNLHKKILNDNVSQFMRKNNIKNYNRYSDFKTSRFVISDIDKKNQASILKKLDSVYTDTNKEFSEKIELLDLDKDVIKDSKKWFHAGAGNSADQASNSARQSRLLKRETTGDQFVHFDKVKDNLVKTKEEAYKSIKAFRRKIRNNPNYRNVFKEKFIEKVLKDGKLVEREVYREVLREDVFDFLRKTKLEPKNYDYIKKTFKKKFGVRIVETDIQNLSKYVSAIDKTFSPSLWVPKREFANLELAEYGGLSADIAGMGAKNFRQIGKDLIDLRDETDPDKILEVLRKGEENVTAHFRDIRDRFTGKIKQFNTSHKYGSSTRCSGDDCVFIPDMKMGVEAKKELVRLFANSKKPSRFRLSIIPKGVEQAQRSSLATHGELVEKELRKKLVGFAQDGIDEKLISPTRAKDLLFITDMPNPKYHNGIKLFVGLRPEIDDIKKASPLTIEEKELIQKTFKDAINKVTDKLGKEVPDYWYYGVNFVD